MKTYVFSKKIGFFLKQKHIHFSMGTQKNIWKLQEKHTKNTGLAGPLTSAKRVLHYSCEKHKLLFHS